MIFKLHTLKKKNCFKNSSAGFFLKLCQIMLCKSQKKNLRMNNHKKNPVYYQKIHLFISKKHRKVRKVEKSPAVF